MTRATQAWLDHEGGAARFGVVGTKRNRAGALLDLHLRVAEELGRRFQPGLAVDWTAVDTSPVPEKLAGELEAGA
jgi:hypothetical protein